VANGLRVLILNWRDVRHPRAGGAEVLTHEHARRLVERGHRVTLFVGAVEAQPGNERIDGVDVIRSGGAVTTRLQAFRWYRSIQREGVRFDIVVEEINTLPYFAPKYVASPVVLWMHQLAREVWWYEAPRPLAAVGFVLERSYLRLYRKQPALVLSSSTRQDLLELGFSADQVQVVPPAIDDGDPGAFPEKEDGLLVYVGRITASKRVDHLIDALARVRQSGIDARLEIVGRGERSEQGALEEVARARSVEHHVRFAGHVDDETKRELLARASLIVMASAREGWGLAVTEANSVGTPAVVYDRPGLRDSTIHEKTGLLTSPDPQALADGITRALTDADLYRRLQAGALEWSRKFTWDRASTAFEAALLRVAGSKR
jgi:glycosyltransferase involved in cell wall biosynthesis